MNETNFQKPVQAGQFSQAYVGACIIALIGLCGIIAFSPHVLIYDEPYHLESARSLADGATLHAVLTAPSHSAPGPLYAVLQAVLSPITRFAAPAVRYVNLSLYLLSIAALAWCLRCWSLSQPWLRAAMVLGVPMVWVCVGMALTEIPAFAMASFGLTAAAWATVQPDHKRAACYFGFIVSGVFAGLAIVGRQTYLPIVIAFVAVAVASRRWRWPAICALVTTCAIPLPMFITWGGLMPATQAHTGGGIAVEHGLLAFAYLGIVLAILAPRFFVAVWRWSLAAASLGLLINLLFIHFEWRAAAGLSKRLPQFLERHYTLVVGSMLVAVFAGFAVAAAANLWQRRDDRLFALSLLQTTLLTATAFGIVHLFSSRYVLTGFPFILLTAQPFFMPSKWAALRLVGGAAVGAASLSSYYW